MMKVMANTTVMRTKVSFDFLSGFSQTNLVTELVDTIYVWGGTAKDAKPATLNPSPPHSEKKEGFLDGALQRQEGGTKEPPVKDAMDHIDDILEGIPLGGAHEEISESKGRPGWDRECMHNLALNEACS